MNWDDIGYDYLIEYVQGAPMVFTGRGLQYMGAHTLGFNDHIGVCVVGNYDEKVLQQDKTVVLVRLVASLLILYPHLTVNDIHYHREVANKTCPGLDFASRDFIRRAVGEML
jgi:N-acetylmuramoyl-L-alanine amidase